MQENDKSKNKRIKEIDIKNMGVDIDKNEYKEIVLSQSNKPDFWKAEGFSEV